MPLTYTGDLHIIRRTKFFRGLIALEDKMTTQILLNLAIILFATKALGMIARRLGLPQVVGAVLAGLLIGPAIWPGLGLDFMVLVNPLADGTIDAIKVIAEIGVVMILFSAGLETDLKELKRTGAAATGIALAGVFVPLVLGTVVTSLFLGGVSMLADPEVLIQCLCVGIILTATSVGITVEALKEMGKLNTKIGQTVLSAAIIDDVIGIVVLSVVLSISGGGADVGHTLLMTVLFFVCAIGLGIPINMLFKKLSQKYDHKRRIPIFGLIVCFLYAFCAERLFGIADITGAYIAGIVLCNVKDTSYIDRKIGINSYMLFSPVFFASIGLTTSITIDASVLLFALFFVLMGIIGKVVGCAGLAKCFKFDNTDSLIAGVGMLARGEVALVVCNKVLSAGVFEGSSIDPTLPTILLIVTTSLLAPIGLKLLFGKKDKMENGRIQDMYDRVGQPPLDK